MPNPINPDDLDTYAGWQQRGYQVQRGERHVARTQSISFGEPLFSGRQVAPISRVPQGLRRPGFQQAPRRVRPAERMAAQGETLPQVQISPFVSPPGTGTWGEVWGEEWATTTTTGRFNVGYGQTATNATNTSNAGSSFFASVNAAMEANRRARDIAAQYEWGPVVDHAPTDEERNALQAVRQIELEIDRLNRNPTKVPPEDRHHHGLALLRFHEQQVKKEK